jgi:hypothetical protein
MGFTWDRCPRLALKRQRIRREKGQPQMADLGLIIRATQREAAALSTEALRHEIEMNLEVQDAAICLYDAVTRPGGGSIEDLIVATSTVLNSFVITAVYVRELATRPRDTWTVTASVN